MTTVFIGGSRNVSHLDDNVRQRLDRIVEKQLPVIIGDANGADKAVQSYLTSRGYSKVEVFCMEGKCRNNIGHWKSRAISAPRGTRNFKYYTVKDQAMAQEASVGFMLWDGMSLGTLANAVRLIGQRKKVVVYHASTRMFTELTCEADWKEFLGSCPPDLRERLERRVATEEPLSPVRSHSGDLFDR